jgi:hypothetical protein
MSILELCLFFTPIKHVSAPPRTQANAESISAPKVRLCILFSFSDGSFKRPRALPVIVIGRRRALLFVSGSRGCLPHNMLHRWTPRVIQIRVYHLGVLWLYAWRPLPFLHYRGTQVHTQQWHCFCEDLSSHFSYFRTHARLAQSDKRRCTLSRGIIVAREFSPWLPAGVANVCAILRQISTVFIR